MCCIPLNLSAPEKNLQKRLDFIGMLRYNIRDKVEECPVFSGSDRTSMGPKRTIGARFPLSCKAGRERSRPIGVSGKMRNCRNSSARRTGETRACLPYLILSADGSAKRRFLKEMGGMPGHSHIGSGGRTHKSCQRFQPLGKMPKKFVRIFEYMLAFPEMQCYNDTTFI